MYLDKVYHIVNNSITQELCSNIISQGESKELKTGEILDGKQFNRSSKVSWIENRHLELQLIESVKLANKKAGWNFSLADFEPFQYTVYNKDDFYNWHIDSLSEPYDNGYIRKLSFLDVRS